MNEVLQSFIEDPSTKETKDTAFPAANSTSGFQISAGYMHVIVAVYAIVVVLVIFIIIIIVAQSIKRTWRKKGISGYGAIPRQRLDPDVETLDDNSRTYGQHQDDDDSEFDNISLNRGRRDPNDNESDVPPLYENPPSYLDSGNHVDREIDIPPLYENPPSYLCINR